MVNTPLSPGIALTETISSLIHPGAPRSQTLIIIMVVGHIRLPLIEGQAHPAFLGALFVPRPMPHL